MQGWQSNMPYFAFLGTWSVCGGGSRSRPFRHPLPSKSCSARQPPEVGEEKGAAALRRPGSGMAPGHRQRATLAGAVMADRTGAAVDNFDGGMGHAGALRMSPIRDLLSMAGRNDHRVRLI